MGATEEAGKLCPALSWAQTTRPWLSGFSPFNLLSTAKGGPAVHKHPLWYLGHGTGEASPAGLPTSLPSQSPGVPPRNFSAVMSQDPGLGQMVGFSQAWKWGQCGPGGLGSRILICSAFPRPWTLAKEGLGRDDRASQPGDVARWSGGEPVAFNTPSPRQGTWQRAGNPAPGVFRGVTD